MGSGSNGNSTFVSDGESLLLVDAGLACQEIEKRLSSFGVSPETIDAILLSHEHGDHIQGAAQFARKHKTALCSTQGTFHALRRRLHRKVDWQRLRPGDRWKLGRLTVDVFSTPHDAVEPVGFRFQRGRLRFAHVTDIGHISREVEEGLDGAQAILVESNHDVEMLKQGPYPETLKHRVGGRFGHLSNEALARYLEHRLPESVRHLFLAHISHTNNYQQLVLTSCRQALGRRGGPRPAVHLTYQDRPTGLLRLSEPRRAAPGGKQGVLGF